MLLALASIPVAGRADERAPRVAVWNPVFSGGQPWVPVDPDSMSQVAAWLEHRGVLVKLLRADQLRDNQQFSPEQFDALYLPGVGFPWSARLAIQNYCRGGGIVISLGGNPFPLRHALFPAQTGRWVTAPASTQEPAPSPHLLHELMGLEATRSNPTETAPTQVGQKHFTTVLLRKYLPQAPDLTEDLVSPQLQPWTGQKGVVHVYPLVLSHDGSGQPVFPQLSVIENGKAILICGLSDIFFKTRPTSGWKLPIDTTVALAFLARDLRTGTTQLEAVDRMKWPGASPNLEQQAPAPPTH